MTRSSGTRSFTRWLMAAAGACIVSLGPVWFLLGRIAAEKIATALILPAGALWVLMLLATVYLAFTRQRRGAVVMLTVATLYWISGNGRVADAVARSLEEPFVAINPLHVEQRYDFVVVLGGGGGRGANGRLQGSTSGDRMILAAQMYHQQLADHIICTGHRIRSMSPNGVDPAETSREVLTLLGVPPDRITMLGGRNTSEEMVRLGDRFRESSARVGLITSAWHLQRALRLARGNGFHPDPLPADFWSGYRGESGPTPARMIESFIPNAGAMLVCWYCAKEHLGMLAGR